MEKIVYRSEDAAQRVRSETRLAQALLGILSVNAVLLLLAIQGLLGAAVACLVLDPLLFMLVRGRTVFRWATSRIASPSLLDPSNRLTLLSACALSCAGPSLAGVLLVPLVLGAGSPWIAVPFLGLLVSLLGFFLGAGRQDFTAGRVES